MMPEGKKLCASTFGLEGVSSDVCVCAGETKTLGLLFECGSCAHLIGRGLGTYACNRRLSSADTTWIDSSDIFTHPGSGVFDRFQGCQLPPSTHPHTPGIIPFVTRGPCSLASTSTKMSLDLLFFSENDASSRVLLKSSSRSHRQ